MDFEETMVDEIVNDEGADDALPEEVADETDESEGESLDSLSGDEEDEPEEEPQKDAPSEPGWIKKRVEKAVNKAVAQALAQQQAEFERQMAPLRERALNDEAKELVRQGEFKSLERAKEYLQLKQGMPVQPAPEQPQPSDQGQNTRSNDPATMARIDMLKHQADRIQASGGPDVIGEFKRNKEVQRRIVSGEMDLYDLAEEMKAPKRKPPSPMRSPNGASGTTPNAIDSMSDAAFARLEKRIKEGARYSLK